MKKRWTKSVLLWILMLLVVFSQSSMAFAAKPVKPPVEPTSLLDITTIDFTENVPNDKPYEFFVEATMKQYFDVVWWSNASGDNHLDFINSEESQKKVGKTTTYYEKALFRFTPIDDNQSRTVSFTIFASDNVDGIINKDHINVTFIVEPIEDQTNTPPVTVDDQVEGKVGSEMLIEPLINDFDEDGDVITLVSARYTDGTVVLIEGDFIRFTPLEVGTITLYYVISDGEVTAEGTITVNVTGTRNSFIYVALGDSIPAGVSYEKSSTLKIIESYTDKIYNNLLNQYDNVEYYDTAISGMNIYSPTDNTIPKEISLYDQVMFDDDIRSYIASADLITLCIGANDIMDAAPLSTTGRDFYNIDWKKADSGLDNIYEYWDDIINEIYILNSDVELVVMNMYNPYRISDSKKNNKSHEVYGFNAMHFLVNKYFYSVEDLNPSKNDGIDYGLNYIIENPDIVYDNFSHQYKVVNVYDYFEANDPTKSKLIAFYDNKVWVQIPIIRVQVLVKDPHPTLLGQTRLYDLHAATMGW